MHADRLWMRLLDCPHCVLPCAPRALRVCAARSAPAFFPYRFAVGRTLTGFGSLRCAPISVCAGFRVGFTAAYRAHMLRYALRTHCAFRRGWLLLRLDHLHLRFAFAVLPDRLRVARTGSFVCAPTRGCACGVLRVPRCRVPVAVCAASVPHLPPYVSRTHLALRFAHRAGDRYALLRVARLLRVTQHFYVVVDQLPARRSLRFACRAAPRLHSFCDACRIVAFSLLRSLRVPAHRTLPAPTLRSRLPACGCYTHALCHALRFATHCVTRSAHRFALRGLRSVLLYAFAAHRFAFFGCCGANNAPLRTVPHALRRFAARTRGSCVSLLLRLTLPHFPNMICYVSRIVPCCTRCRFAPARVLRFAVTIVVATRSLRCVRMARCLPFAVRAVRAHTLRCLHPTRRS